MFPIFSPPFLAYMVISLIVAVFGANRKLGFWGYFFASLLLTPLIGGLLVIVSEKKKSLR